MHHNFVIMYVWLEYAFPSYVDVYPTSLLLFSPDQKDAGQTCSRPLIPQSPMNVPIHDHTPHSYGGFVSACHLECTPCNNGDSRCPEDSVKVLKDDIP